MDRILPEIVSDIASKSIEHVYSYAPIAEKTVILGKHRNLLNSMRSA